MPTPLIWVGRDSGFGNGPYPGSPTVLEAIYLTDFTPNAVSQFEAMFYLNGQMYLAYSVAGGNAYITKPSITLGPSSITAKSFTAVLGPQVPVAAAFTAPLGYDPTKAYFLLGNTNEIYRFDGAALTLIRSQADFVAAGNNFTNYVSDGTNFYLLESRVSPYNGTTGSIHKTANSGTSWTVPGSGVIPGYRIAWGGSGKIGADVWFMSYEAPSHSIFGPYDIFMTKITGGGSGITDVAVATNQFYNPSSYYNAGRNMVAFNSKLYFTRRPGAAAGGDYHLYSFDGVTIVDLGTLTPTGSSHQLRAADDGLEVYDVISDTFGSAVKTVKKTTDMTTWTTVLDYPAGASLTTNGRPTFTATAAELFYM